MKVLIALADKYLFTIVLISFSCNNQNTSFEINNSEVANFMYGYREAWKDGDSSAVLNMLSPDIVLFQAGKTARPVIGKKEVANFWLPKSDLSYPILDYVISNEEINGSGDLAYYQGTSHLTWYTM